MIEPRYLDDCLLQLEVEDAGRQGYHEHVFAVLDPEANSIAVIEKHLARNMRALD